jgi:hypothetical protein
MEQHDTPTDTFAEFQTRADAMNTAATRNMLNQRFTLRGQLTEVQWALLFASPSK